LVSVSEQRTAFVALPQSSSADVYGFKKVLTFPACFVCGRLPRQSMLAGEGETSIHGNQNVRRELLTYGWGT
jgi:hypothetical protein